MPILSDAITNILRLVESNASRSDIVAAISTAHDAAEAVESGKRLAELESQIGTLTQQLQEANLAIDNLPKHAQKQSSTDRPQPEHDILLLLRDRDKLSEEEIAANFHISQQATRHHLTKLKTDKLINSILGPFNSRIPTRYHLDDGGRSYLADRSLL